MRTDWNQRAAEQATGTAPTSRRRPISAQARARMIAVLNRRGKLASPHDHDRALITYMRDSSRANLQKFGETIRQKRNRESGQVPLQRT